MPRIYLSPSTQESNLYVSGGSEEYYMNLLADELIPYLRANTIAYTRNTPQMTAVNSVRQANQGDYDFYLALHSNAAGPANVGKVRGTLVFYYPSSRQGKRAADIFAANLRQIYPLPNNVRTTPTTTLYEVARSRAPAVLIELAYHDNPQDAAWIVGNLPAIASNLAVSLTQFFGLPFISPSPQWWGAADISWGTLNIRAKPDISAPIVARAYAGDKMLILGAWEDWYSVDFDGVLGYVSAQYIR